MLMNRNDFGVEKAANKRSITGILDGFPPASPTISHLFGLYPKIRFLRPKNSATCHAATLVEETLCFSHFFGVS
jgi:hypothetical protein